MAIGELAKQLAGQAIGNAARDVTDALRPGEAPQEAGRGARPTEGTGTAIMGQIQAMQRALKEDQELVVSFQSGAETVRVMECFLPSAQVLVLTGLDRDRNVTRVIAAVESVQLVCKIVKVQPGARPARVQCVVPKPKPE